MPLTAHLTKLQAVNEILSSIGERAVNNLASGLPDADRAEKLLDKESRRIQSMGWHVNTLPNFTLTLNASSQFALPDNTLKADTVNPRGNRLTSSPAHSAYVNAAMRRSDDDTKWLMFDVNNNTEVWTEPTTLSVEIVQLLEFANLGPALQIYVWTSAAHRFQKTGMGSGVLHEFTKEDVSEARLGAVNEDMENEDLNIIRDNAHVQGIVFRNNPSYGR